MKGLRKYLTPFAPDQSGAVSVLYELGGILVICDAGGCTGNVCGFDEPRWFSRKSAVFSAGLRDMDAILGRDDRLGEKLTDYRALERMSEKKIDLPILTVDTDGMELYDAGEEKAYSALFRTFAKEKFPVEDGRIGVLGMTPQDVSDLSASEKVKTALQKEGCHAICYGMGDGVEVVKKASMAQKNLVVSPSALVAARYLEKTFGTPYEVGYPIVGELVPEMDYRGKKILVVHQQVIANAVREEIRKRAQDEVTIITASWFSVKSELREIGDLALKEEEEYMELVETGEWDVIFADTCMQRMTPKFAGTFIDIPHFAVSGRLV